MKFVIEANNIIVNDEKRRLLNDDVSTDNHYEEEGTVTTVVKRDNNEIIAPILTFPSSLSSSSTIAKFFTFAAAFVLVVVSMLVMTTMIAFKTNANIASDNVHPTTTTISSTSVGIIENNNSNNNIKIDKESSLVYSSSSSPSLSLTTTEGTSASLIYDYDVGYDCYSDPNHCAHTKCTGFFCPAICNYCGYKPVIPVCPESGYGVYYPDGGSQTPGTIWYGLDFNIESYKRFHTKFDDDTDAVWQDCAKSCNDDYKCRTFSVHIEGNLFHPYKAAWVGDCYLHKDWLCNKGTRYHPNPVHPKRTVSGVCRPEMIGNDGKTPVCS